MKGRSRIFISYRRSETDGSARLVHAYLQQRLGAQRVFMDIKGIRPGDVFRQTIARELERCDTMIAVISRGWTGEEGAGRSRLLDEHDFVRHEVESALKRGIRVIPVLIHPMRMPPAEALPEGLRFLRGLQYQEVQLGQRFEADMAHVLAVLEPEAKGGVHKQAWLVAAGVAVLLSSGVAVWSFLHPASPGREAVVPADSIPRPVPRDSSTTYPEPGPVAPPSDRITDEHKPNGPTTGPEKKPARESDEPGTELVNDASDRARRAVASGLAELNGVTFSDILPGMDHMQFVAGERPGELTVSGRVKGLALEGRMRQAGLVVHVLKDAGGTLESGSLLVDTMEMKLSGMLMVRSALTGTTVPVSVKLFR